MQSTRASLQTRLILLALISLLVSGSACNEKKQGQLVKSYTLFYYPKLNTYFNPADSHFLYTLDGGITWQRKQGSIALANILDEKVTIESPLPDGWQNNEAHRKQYNGVYTNYAISAKTDTLGDYEGVVEEKEPIPVQENSKTANQDEPKEEQKKGFKKIRDNIRKLFKKDN